MRPHQIAGRANVSVVLSRHAQIRCLDALAGPCGKHVHGVRQRPVSSRLYRRDPAVWRRTLDLVQALQDRGIRFFGSFGVGFDGTGDDQLTAFSNSANRRMSRRRNFLSPRRCRVRLSGSALRSKQVYSAKELGRVQLRQYCFQARTHFGRQASRGVCAVVERLFQTRSGRIAFRLSPKGGKYIEIQGIFAKGEGGGGQRVNALRDSFARHEKPPQESLSALTLWPPPPSPFANIPWISIYFPPFGERRKAILPDPRLQKSLSTTAQTPREACLPK